MSRTLPVGVSGVLGDDVIFPAIAIDLDFDSAPVYLWSGQGDITANSKLYIGTSKIMTISRLEETASIKAAGATIQLTGIPSDILALALAEQYQFRDARIYHVEIAPPNTANNFAVMWSGFMTRWTSTSMAKLA